jgi:hypothetical protein
LSFAPGTGHVSLRWTRSARKDVVRANSSRLPSDEKRELAELRKKARGLEVENEIVAAAART